MNYKEFKETYKRTLKKYPGTSFTFGVENIGLKIVRQIKNGSRWNTTEQKEKTVDYEFYMNTVDAIPFFKNLGGSERVSQSYTKIAYLPVEITSTSPDRSKRTIYTFTF